ncbi:hypothetical protein VVR12_03345 [Rothia sp. LK2588]|uniref:hypothetical protein n=1 Tax=Rothia sp. LK2588 TaxID=3114369 RepID=UPI0034CF6BFA
MAMDDSRLVRSATLTQGDWSLTMNTHASETAPYQPLLQELDGWYGGVGVSAQNEQRKLGHGVFPEPSLRTGRQITLGGLFFFGSEADRTVGDRFISGILWDGEFADLTVDVGGVETLTARVKLDGEIKHKPIGDDGIQWEAPLFAPDPFLYAPARTYQVFPAGFGEGLQYPLFATKKNADGVPVLDWGKGAPVGGAFGNQGNATAYPVFTVQGSWPAGFDIVTNGRTISYPAPVDPSSPVVIDNREGSVMSSGYDQTYRLTSRDWVEVSPGESIQPRIIAHAPSNGWLDIQLSDTYI